MKNPYIRSLIITLGLLLVPLVLQLTIGTGVDGQGFNWKAGDFLVMGILIFIAVTALDIVWRKSKNRVVGVVLVLLAFLYLWAELAVGIFTNWGS